MQNRQNFGRVYPNQPGQQPQGTPQQQSLPPSSSSAHQHNMPMTGQHPSHMLQQGVPMSQGTAQMSQGNTGHYMSHMSHPSHHLTPQQQQQQQQQQQASHRPGTTSMMSQQMNQGILQKQMNMGMSMPQTHNMPPHGHNIPHSHSMSHSIPMQYQHQQQQPHGIPSHPSQQAQSQQMHQVRPGMMSVPQQQQYIQMPQMMPGQHAMQNRPQVIQQQMHGHQPQHLSQPHIGQSHHMTQQGQHMTQQPPHGLPQGHPQGQPLHISHQQPQGPSNTTNSFSMDQIKKFQDLYQSFRVLVKRYNDSRLSTMVNEFVNANPSLISSHSATTHPASSHPATTTTPVMNQNAPYMMNEGDLRDKKGKPFVFTSDPTASTPSVDYLLAKAGIDLERDRDREKEKEKEKEKDKEKDKEEESKTKTKEVKITKKALKEKEKAAALAAAASNANAQSQALNSASSAPPLDSSISMASSLPSSSSFTPNPTEIDSKSTLKSSQKLSLSSTTSTSSTNLTTLTPATPPPNLNLSWQCCHALLTLGSGKLLPENSISYSPNDVGCFSKSGNVPLILTIPYILMLQERMLLRNFFYKKSNILKFIKEKEIQISDRVIEIVDKKEEEKNSKKRLSTNTEDEEKRKKPINKTISMIEEMKLSTISNFFQQRSLRTSFISTYKSLPSYTSNPFNSTLLSKQPSSSAFSSLLTGNYSTFSVHPSSYYRTRKQSKRDIKNFEKEEKRKKNEYELKKKTKTNEFFKTLFEHRDDFFKFHRTVKSECSKAAKAVKAQVEKQILDKEKMESQKEIKRLQALKENDMEAYMALVQETKNGRLKFLLNETDNYIAHINKLIAEQRHDSNFISGTEASTSTTIINKNENEKLTQTAKNYYHSTHKNIETVIQPTLLKGGDLKEYQLSGLQWLVSLYNNNLNGILADEMGLGKTIQTIALIAYLMEFKNNNGPFMICVPLSTLSNWDNEFNKWLPNIIKVVYNGNPEERKKIYHNEIENKFFNIIVTTYDYVMKDKTQLKKIYWQYIIVDEGHRMKNTQSKFAQTLGTSYQSKHRILLTGTPLQNNLPELWALLNFLLPTIFNSVDTFEQWFTKPFAAFKNSASNNGVEDDENSNTLSQEERMLIVQRLHEVLRPFVLRRVKDQVLDQLPEKVEKVLRCALSGWQRKMYHSITARGLSNKEGGGSGGGLNNTIMQLRKVCNHPYLFTKEYLVDDDLIRVSGKFELLNRMLPKLHAAGHRVLIFSQMVEVMNFLELFLAHKKLNFLRLDGNTSSDEREKRMYAFNDPNSPYFVFLLSTRAGGLGLNLATADTVIIFDSDWNPMADAQAQDRAHRIGQKNEVRVFRLLTNSAVEDRIFARATEKLNLTGLVVEAGKFNAKNSNQSSIQSSSVDDPNNKEMMETLLKELSMSGSSSSSSSSTNNYDNINEDDDYDNIEESEIPNDEEINKMMATYEGEFELYERMDREREEKLKKKHEEALKLNPNAVYKPPLMSATEIPSWMTEDSWSSKYSMLMNDMMKTKTERNIKKNSSLKGSIDGYDLDDYDDLSEDQIKAGKLMRKRKAVKYDDGLTESQFQRLIEKQQLDTTVAIGGPGNAPIMSTATKKKVKTPVPSGPLHEFSTELIRIITSIQKMKLPSGYFLTEYFNEKPSKTYYPSYYTLVKLPISLKEILNKIKTQEYKFFEEIEIDFLQMSFNARIFNSDQSPVFTSAEKVREEFYLQAVPLCKKFGVTAFSDHFNGKMPPLPNDEKQFNMIKQRNFVGKLPSSNPESSSAEVDTPEVQPKKKIKKATSAPSLSSASLASAPPSASSAAPSPSSTALKPIKFKLSLPGKSTQTSASTSTSSSVPTISISRQISTSTTPTDPPAKKSFVISLKPKPKA